MLLIGKVKYFLLAASTVIFSGCGSKPDFEKIEKKYFTPIHTDLTYLKDRYGRYIYIRGVNVSGSSKFPSSTDPISFVGKPFPLEKADEYFELISKLGFNSIRLLVIWEAIEPDQPGQFDTEYLDFIEQIVEKANEHSIYVLIDMHQDGFSRHLFVKYNDRPSYRDVTGQIIHPAKGSLEAMVFALVPDENGSYPEQVRGDGAPRWAVQACLPEKDMDSPFWGTFRALGAISSDSISRIIAILSKLAPSTDDSMSVEVPDWINQFLERLPPSFEFNESTDLLPWTNWGINMGLSLDVQRCFASFFAGDKIYPDYEVDGKSVKDFLQEEYIASYLEIVKRVKDYPNVIGYDLMNEPIGIFVVLSAVASYFQTGMEQGVKTMLSNMLGEELGGEFYELLSSLYLLPRDSSEETRRMWGMDGIDLQAVIDLNYGFDQKYLQPFYEKLGHEIQQVDPDAIIWFESSISLLTFFQGIGGKYMEINMRKPAGLLQVVYAPHFYADIYPFFGFNMPPRDFTFEEVRYRDYTQQIKDIYDKSAYSLGNVPVVFGEFGTYFNFGGIDTSRQLNYAVSGAILNNYYESFEKLFIGSMLWCFSPENDYRFGDGWNKEDFSIIDPDGRPRGQKLYSRPYPRAISGKPRQMHFYSDYHYFDPIKGKVNPVHEFYLQFESKETDAPTEIFIPLIQYPDGFYVWISDGYGIFDFQSQIFYFFPERDEPDFIHEVTIRPPQKGQENENWNYFIKDGYLLDGR